MSLKDIGISVRPGSILGRRDRLRVAVEELAAEYENYRVGAELLNCPVEALIYENVVAALKEALDE